MKRSRVCFWISLTIFFILLIVPGIFTSKSVISNESIGASESSLPVISFFVFTGRLDIFWTIRNSKYSDFRHLLKDEKILIPQYGNLYIYLLCNHSRPAKWVTDDKWVKEEKSHKEEMELDRSYTSRQAFNYSDPSLDRFNAVVRIRIYNESLSHQTYICEDIQDRCNNRIVLTNITRDSNHVVLKNIYDSDINLNPETLNFISKTEQVEAINKANNESCLTRLNLYYIDSPNANHKLRYTLDDHDASLIPFNAATAQAGENFNRLIPKLGEQCVSLYHLNSSSNMKETCPLCELLDLKYDRTAGFLQFLIELRGDQRMFNVLFDLTVRRIHFEGEHVDFSNLTEIEDTNGNQQQLEFVMGQEMKFLCSASSGKFSMGVILLWGFPGDVEPQEAIPLNDENTYLAFRKHAFHRFMRLSVSREVLAARNASFINITCLFPVWDTTEWVAKSKPAFISSEFPLATLDNSESGSEINNGSVIAAESGGSIRVTCTGRGFPDPNIQFYAEKQQANSPKSELTHGYPVKSILLLALNDTNHHGAYYCRVFNSLGESHIFFTVGEIAGLSKFINDTSFNLTTAKVVPATALNLTRAALVAATVLVVFIFIGSVVFLKRNRRNARNMEEQPKIELQDLSSEVAYRNENFISKLVNSYSQLPFTNYRKLELNDFQICHEQILGSGTHGLVLKAKVANEWVAAKTTKPNSSLAETGTIMEEVKILAYLGNHTNVVSLVGAYTKDLHAGLVYAFVELCPLGSVHSYLRAKRTELCQQKTVLPDKQDISNDTLEFLNHVMKWSLQTADGMEYLTTKKVIHGDLATRNLLLKDLNTVKITDFGLSRQLHNYSIYKKTQQQPLPWRHMAPESLSDMEFSHKSDVWSFGVTLWELFSFGSIPYSGLQWDVKFTSTLEQGLRLKQPSLSSNETWDVMDSCWSLNADARPDFCAISETLRTILVASYDNDYLKLND